MAEILIKEYNLDKVIFVPVGNYYKKSDMIDSSHRYNMLKLAIEGNKQLEVEKIAVESKVKLYASDTFKLIKEKYKEEDIFFIMGSDNFRKMPTWKNYEELMKSYNMIVIERERKEARNENSKNIIEFIPKNIYTFLPPSYWKVDSTQIREMIKNNRDVKEYLNINVYKYIKDNKLYI